MGKWESTLTKKHGKTIEEYTARLKGGMFKIEVGEGSGGPYAILYRWDDLRGLERIASGNLQSLMRQAESMGAKEARGVAAVERLANYARPGAKAKMGRGYSGKTFRLNTGDVVAAYDNGDPAGFANETQAQAFSDRYNLGRVFRTSRGRMFYVLPSKEESSRPGAKAKMGLSEVLSFVNRALQNAPAGLPRDVVEESLLRYWNHTQAAKKMEQRGDLANATKHRAEAGREVRIYTELWYKMGKSASDLKAITDALNKMTASRPGAKAKFAEDAREVAQEILRQLGGGRFMAMVGGKNAFHGTFGGKAGLQFDIGKGADGGVNRVIVKLDRGTDTYDMEFWRIGNRGMNVKKVSEASGVYADDLQRIFTSRTKFYTSLSRPGAKAKFGITNAASAFLKKMLREYASMKGTRWYDEAKYISDNPTEHTDADVIAAVGNLKLAKSVSSRPGAKVRNAIREGEKVSASDDAVSRKIRKLMDEGKPQKQAVAIALDLERRGEL
jgi:hypothetical protein